MIGKENCFKQDARTRDEVEILISEISVFCSIEAMTETSIVQE